MAVNPNVAEKQTTSPPAGVDAISSAQPKAEKQTVSQPKAEQQTIAPPYAANQPPTISAPSFNGGNNLAVDRIAQTLQAEEDRRAQSQRKTTQLLGGPNETRERATGSGNYLYEPGGSTQPSLKEQILAGRTNDDGNDDGGDDPTYGPGAGAGGSSAPAAPTVDTSATAPDPYQALIDQYAKSSGQTIEEATKAIDDIIAQLQGNLPNANGGRVDRVNTTEQENLLAQIVAAQQEQAKRRNDYAVQQGVDQLNRAMEDAAPQFQTMRNQAAAAEAQALDNQALYAEARGDRGGIGAAQYASIQNTAAQNQLTVNREQTKLATDTARQIADLRAQGEFKKADELLSITQSYLSELMQLKQWADQANISIDEFNIGVQQWEQEYNSKIQQALAGMKMDAAQWSAGQNLDNDRDVLNMTLSNMQQQENKQAKVAEQMIAAGISPTDQQLQAIGWNKDQFAAYKALLAAANSGGGGGKKDTFLDELKGAIEDGLDYASALSAINQAKASELHDAQIIKDAYALINRNKSLMGKVNSP